LNRAHDETPGCATLSTLETTAGQGTNLGYRFEQLATIIDLVKDQKRMAVCIDTCHLFAAGYQITTEEGWEQTMSEFDRILGMNFVTAIHVNDSAKPFASRIDRHEHIGKGQIGITAFRMLMNDPRFDRIPKILETEKDEQMTEDVENMSVLASLIRQPGSG
jgi:deoxyribonuclease-4